MRATYEISVEELSHVIANYVSTKVGKSGEVNVSITTPPGYKAKSIIARASYGK